jgi:hypothetical protein
MIYRFKWLILFAFITGLIILLLPDKNKPLIEFNRSHGPSFTDLIGLVLIFISWMICLVDIIKSWKRLKINRGERTLFTLLFIYVASIAGVIIALNSSTEIFLWISVAVASMVNITLIIFAYKTALNNS